jgi:hypothetical protein
MVENTIGDTKMLFPVIFPDKMVHADVYKKLKSAMPGWHHGGVRAVSAGTIEHIEAEGLGGGSETLGLVASGDDAKTIEIYSYFHGIVTGRTKL